MLIFFICIGLLLSVFVVRKYDVDEVLFFIKILFGVL